MVEGLNKSIGSQQKTLTNGQLFVNIFAIKILCYVVALGTRHNSNIFIDNILY